MLKRILLGASVLALAACGGDGGGSNTRSLDYAASPAPSAPMMMERAATEESFALDQSAPEAEPTPEAPEQFIAYSHSLGLSLPKGGVDPMMEAHAEACRAAGTATCIVVNSNIYSEDVAYASGNLSIRAKPDWIEAFLAGLDEQTSEAGGEITQRSTRAEDLTRQILDTGARLEAQKTLQARLLELLQRRDGELGELLQIEREYANVTGQIESIEAQLKTLRLRVAMSSLDISYSTKVPPFSATRQNPMAEAFGDFFYNLSYAIGSVVTAFAVGLPWLALIGLFLWIWLKLIWPRIRGKKKA